MKKYKLSISKSFPKPHPRADESTNFKEMIESGKKIHTIRGNFELWKKRIDEVNAGNAVIIGYEWSGLPYRSKHNNLFILDKNSGIGIQQLTMHKATIDSICSQIDIRHPGISLAKIAEKDGLGYIDFCRWFFPNINKANVLFDGGIIHFTKYRY